VVLHLLYCEFYTEGSRVRPYCSMLTAGFAFCTCYEPGKTSWKKQNKACGVRAYHAERTVVGDFFYMKKRGKRGGTLLGTNLRLTPEPRKKLQGRGRVRKFQASHGLSKILLGGKRSWGVREQSSKWAWLVPPGQELVTRDWGRMHSWDDRTWLRFYEEKND